MNFFRLTAALVSSGFAIGNAPALAANGHSYSRACAPSYHLDHQGNCQPNLAQTNRYCPPGEVYHPSPDGWFCDAPSGGRTYYN